VTVIDAKQMARRGVCLEATTDHASNFTFLFAEQPGEPASCYHCVRVFARTVNIVEKIETGCVTLPRLRPGELPSLARVCRELDPESQIITLFRENYTPVNCRSALEGVFHFAYQVIDIVPFWLIIVRV